MIQSWYNNNVTRLTTTQACNNIVISRLYRTCWNNLATSLIISTRLLQVVNSLFQTCWQLGISSANTTCWQLVGRLAIRYETKTNIIHFILLWTKNAEKSFNMLQSYSNKIMILRKSFDDQDAWHYINIQENTVKNHI
jgi:hypothetical protein